MHVQSGLPGKKRCVLWLTEKNYLEVHPHALAPPVGMVEDALHVEYVKDGRLRGQCWLPADSAMRLQLDLLRGEPRASNWLILNLEGRSVGAQKVSEIHTLLYEVSP